jgi:hypothetical protein
VRLRGYLDAEGKERAARDANAWVKSLRHARADGASFRERFTYLGDSLWWFAELYLHKERVAQEIFAALNAGTALLDREAPSAIWVDESSEAARLVMPQLCRARAVAYDGPPPPVYSRVRRLRMDLRSSALTFAAVASPERPMRRPHLTGSTAVAAFVHRAFWRGGREDGSAESYIGPVLQALERRIIPGSLRYVGVGPASNFRTRRWWRREADRPRAVIPIEALVSRGALAGSVGVWAARHAMRRALDSSEDLRSAAVIRGCDCWPLVAQALDGVALLQFPWSARAMDEAGAAFDVLAPSAALTYAEAGGWGRALALEARRRRIPLAGLQHGFIYRHWLNYLHEPDEMEPLREGSADAGFPRPALTLVFDKYAERHLRDAGGFPAAAIGVTGSPRLDVLAATLKDMEEADPGVFLHRANLDPSKPVVLLVTKYAEARAALPALLEALRAMPGVQLAVKTHPAETDTPYREAASGIDNVRVLGPSADLAPLLRAARAVVTVNSTVAIDAIIMGVPSLALDVPNNLSPFVDRGAMAGVAADGDVGGTLTRVLYDEKFRDQLRTTAAEMVQEYGMAPDGRAAERSAAAILALTGPRDRTDEE